MTTVSKHFITARGLERLQSKIAAMKERLKAIQEEKAHAYNASGDGWHDNPGWLQLGQQEEQLSADIVALETRLSTAVLYKGNVQADGKVAIGSRVTYRMEHLHEKGRCSELTIEIVGSGESNIRERLVSYDSPIGAALFNMEVGQQKEVDLPNGAFRLTLITIQYE